MYKSINPRNYFSFPNHENLNPLLLWYVFVISTKPFSSPDVPPTIEQIFHSFGDTLPGGEH